MLSIESRPIRDKNWEYIFFVNIEGSLNDDNVRRALKGVQEGSSSMRILGCYQKTHQ
jgi:chorismate mutase/prephenate dehydratase